jgi:hypothetical protein
MPTELIGEFGTPGAEREWIVAECELAIKHLTRVCGEPPPEMELEIQWQEHDLGEYPTIVLTWEDAMRGAPWEYIAKCERALTTYEYGEEPQRWSLPALDPDEDEKEDDDSLDPDFPREPREGASFFELRQYLSALNKYAADACIRARRKPKVVHADDDLPDKRHG